MALTSATSRKTLQLDILQLGKLNFLTTSNTPIPSSFILSANGNGTTSFVPISTLITDFYPPGQAYVASTVQSTMYNTLTYPNITSSISYKGNSGLTNMLVYPQLSNTFSLFSSITYNFSSISNYINPNGSSRMFLEYYPNFTFSPVITPSSISSVTLYPEGNSSIKNVISLSSHLTYYNPINNSNITIPKSGVQQYINVNATYPFNAYSTMTYRPSSNSFIQPIHIEIDSSIASYNFNLLHYISDGSASLKTIGGNDVVRSGLERSTLNINNNVGDKNSVFVTITNSGNQF